MNTIFLIYLNACYHLHVYWLVLTMFQFLLLSHCCHMHETILHKHSPNRQTTSPTCMIICLLNLSFMFHMHCRSLLLSLSISMHSLTYLLSISPQRVGPTLARALPLLKLHCTVWERKARIPLQICAFLPSTALWELFAHFGGQWM